MIFISVGTERFPFDRLIEIADSLQEKLGDEKVLVQLGESRILPKKCAWVRVMPFHEMVEAVTQARVVISHAGVGAMLLCARQGKVPVIVPRQKRFGEHLDDHQQELAEKMSELGYAILIQDPHTIVDQILELGKAPAKSKQHFSSRLQLSNAILSYVSGVSSSLESLSKSRER